MFKHSYTCKECGSLFFTKAEYADGFICTPCLGKINKIHALVRVREDGTEVVLASDPMHSVIAGRWQEMRWSFTQNTGRERTDLKIVTFERTSR